MSVALCDRVVPGCHLVGDRTPLGKGCDVLGYARCGYLVGIGVTLRT